MSQRLPYKRLIVYLEICKEPKGMSGNRSLSQIARMLSVTTFMPHTRDFSAKTENKEEEAKEGNPFKFSSYSSKSKLFRLMEKHDL